MKTVQRKNARIEFEPASDTELEQLVASHIGEDINVPSPCDGETLFVKVGRDIVGVVSIVYGDGEILVTQLYVLPQFRSFGVGTQILECLSSFRAVNYLRVLATPSTAAFYEDRGFERDAGHIVLTKVLV